MSKTLSTPTTGNNGSNASAHSDPADRVNMRMMQNVLLIWLDASIDESNTDCQKTITHLRRVIDNINTFTDADQCVDSLEEVQDSKVWMMIAGLLGEHIVPCIHDISQVDSIFIFRDNEQYHEQWAKNWSKVKGLYTDIELICDALKQSAQICEQNAIGFSLVATDTDLSNMNLDRLDPMFMYIQIVKEILLVIQFEQKHLLAFTKYCGELFENDHAYQLNKVQAFEGDYRSRTPIWWYTSEVFLYSMLNRALRLSNMDVIVKMGFFIGDLHKQIEELHTEQYGGSNAETELTVYRGQEMSKEELGKISKTKGGLIAFNNFLSTSRTESVATFFAESVLANPDSVAVVFEMKIHPRQSTTPFASVAAVGAFGDSENEILFAMQTVFRIRDIQNLDGNARLFRVILELTSDNDHDLQVLTKRIREETFPGDISWSRLGLVLEKLGRPKQAEEVYQTLIEQESDESKMGQVYNRLGSCKMNRGEYDEAVQLYKKSIAINEECSPNSIDLAMSYNNIGLLYSKLNENTEALSSHKKALAIKQHSLPLNHPDLAGSYNNIGMVYSNMGEYAEALLSYENALTIQLQSLPSNHPDLGMSYNNIGNINQEMGDYTKALSSHEKALAIRIRSLPPNHPDLAISYNNIGLVYDNMGEYANALSSHENALTIQQQSLPPNHPDLGMSYNNIGLEYYNMGEYTRALSYYKESLAIRHQSLPSNHPDLGMSYNNIGNVFDSMGDYAKALSSHEKALAIRIRSLPSNHLDLAASHSNIGNVYYNMSDYAKALSSHEKALAIEQQSLPPDHLRFAMSYNNIGSVYYNMGEYARALSYYKKSLAIKQQLLPPNHPDLAVSYNNIGNVYHNTGEYTQALLYYGKSLVIREQSLPPIHPDLAASYSNIGFVYESMEKYPEAYSFYEKAVKIGEQSLPLNHPHRKMYENSLDIVKNKLGR